MTSHGVARTVRTRTEEQRRQELEKIRKYRALEDQVRGRATDQQFDHDTFQLASQLLRLNPEYYTIWNVRRRCLTHGMFSTPLTPTAPPPTPYPPSIAGEDDPTTGPRDADRGADPQNHDESLIRSELGLTMPLLIEHPKCYWIWKYRLWILNQAMERLPTDTARVVWAEELALISKMLHKDRRNFHAWGYRRHVVSRLESAALMGQSMVEQEFDYTTKMIRLDLSNFSAWHNRSQLIRRLLLARHLGDASRKDFLQAELALVRGALNVGPDDQSLWYYHRYLISNLVGPNDGQSIAPHLSTTDRKYFVRGEIANIRELAEDYTDVKWIYEALVEYTLALRLLGSPRVDSQERGELVLWLGKLRGLDRKRSGRWNDLEGGLGL